MGKYVTRYQEVVHLEEKRNNIFSYNTCYGKPRQIQKDTECGQKRDPKYISQGNVQRVTHAYHMPDLSIEISPKFHHRFHDSSSKFVISGSAYALAVVP